MKTLWKRLCMGIKEKLAGFLAISVLSLALTCLFCGFLSSVDSARNNIDKYYDTHRVYDIRISSSIGFEESDLDSFEYEFYLTDIMPVYEENEEMKDGEDTLSVSIVSAELVDQKGHLINGFTLANGRLPQSESECLVGVQNKELLGKTLVFTKNEFNKTESVTVVGAVNSPAYDNGKVEENENAVLFLSSESYAAEKYTCIFARVYNAHNLIRFTWEYSELLGSAIFDLELFGEDFCDSQYNRLYTEAQNKVDADLADYEKKKNESDTRFEKIRKELDDRVSALGILKEEYERDLEDYTARLAQANDLKQKLDKTANEQRELIESQKQFMTYDRYLAALETLELSYSSSVENLNKTYFIPLSQEEALLTERSNNINETQSAIEDDEREYSVESAEAEENFSIMYEKIVLAQKAVNEIGMPEWTISDISGNENYKSAQKTIGIISTVTKVLCTLLFVAIALLIWYSKKSTDKKQNISFIAPAYLELKGTYRIVFYSIYVSLASLAGAIVGSIIGALIIPRAFFAMSEYMRSLTVLQTKPFASEIIVTLMLTCVLSFVGAWLRIYATIKKSEKGK